MNRFVAVGNLLPACAVLAALFSRPAFADTATPAEGFRLLQAQAYREAAAVLGRALEEAPENTLVRYHLGLALFHLGDFPAAGRHLARALADGLPEAGQVEDAFNRLAETYRANRQWPEMIAAAEKAAAALAGKRGARRQIQAVNSQKVLAHRNLAEEMFAQGEFAAARDHYLAALEVTPRNAGLRHRLGVCLEALGLGDEARAAFHQALGDSVNWRSTLPALVSLAAYLDGPAAWNRLRGELAADPVGARISLLLEKGVGGRYGEAVDLLAELERAMETGGDFAVRLASLVDRDGDFAREILFFIARRYPANAGLERLVGRLWERARGNPEETETIRTRLARALEEAAAERPADDAAGQRAWLMLAGVMARDRENAPETLETQLAFYRDFQARFPGSALCDEVREKEGVLLAEKLGRLEEGIAVFDALVEKKDKAGLLPRLAAWRREAGDFPGAVAALERHLDSRPGDFDALVELAGVQLEAGNIAAGLGLIERVKATAPDARVRERAERLTAGYRAWEAAAAPEDGGTVLAARVRLGGHYAAGTGSIEPATPVLHQRSVGIDAQPFSREAGAYRLGVSALSREMPALAEPFSLAFRESGNYAVHWRFGCFTGPDTMRKEEFHRLVFPWREEPAGIGLARTGYAAGEPWDGSLKVVFNAPGSGWTVRVAHLARAGRLGQPQPPADRTEPGPVMVYERVNAGAEGGWTLEIPFTPVAGLEFYYPGITLEKREESALAAGESGPDGIRIPEQGGVIFLLAPEPGTRPGEITLVSEISWELAERVEPR